MKKTTRRRPTPAPAPARRQSRRPNRRRVALIPRILPFLLVGLLAEFLAALLYSPRFQLKAVALFGNQMASQEVLLQRLAVTAGTPLIKVSPRHLEAALKEEPLLASAQVWQRWPDTLVVQVQERVATMSAKVSGQWWEVDRYGVAFRTVSAPAHTLPMILMRDGITLKPGTVLSESTMKTLQTCLGWSKAHPEFRLASISLESGGKVCLNSDGGMPVRLGTPVQLERKLETLTRLVTDYPEIRAGYDIDYVNLYAWDAPAVLPKTAMATPGHPLL
ncbi:MAG: FtsQ-type POTRA domain-containing protein [Armatimonas sp.]